MGAMCSSVTSLHGLSADRHLTLCAQFRCVLSCTKISAIADIQRCHNRCLWCSTCGGGGPKFCGFAGGGGSDAIDARNAARSAFQCTILMDSVSARKTHAVSLRIESQHET